jgi:hypothetical protein
MIKKIIDRLTTRKFLDWDQYENRVNFLDQFQWQQSVRKQNIKRL